MRHLAELRHRLCLLPAVLAILVLSSCDGTNRFATPITGVDGGGGATEDPVPPTVDIIQPAETPRTIHPMVDSLLVRARITDNQAIDSVLFFGFSRRGDPSLGTDREV